MFLVAGVTGQTGSAVAETLLAQGKPVTVIARNTKNAEPWRARGAKIAETELDNTEAMTRALSGAEGAYLLIPPDYGRSGFLESRKRIADAMARAVKASGIPHIVVLSSIGAQVPEGTGLILVNRYAEEVLAPAAPNVTLLRPGFFLENWAPNLPAAQAEGVLHSFSPADKKKVMNSVVDVGRIGAETLLSPARGRRVVDIAGPQEYSSNDIAQAISAEIGREVRVVEVPVSAAAGIVRAAAGMSEDAAQLFAEMQQAANEDRLLHESSDIVRGRVTAREAIRRMLQRSAQSARQ